MPIPTRAGDRLGDLRKATVDAAVPGVPVVEDHDPLQTAVPFPDQQSSGLEPDALARGRPAASLLTKDKNYDFIVANNDDMILGALQTAKQFGLKIPMAGVDGLPETLAAIKKGDLAATVFQDPEGQGGGTAALRASTMVRSAPAEGACYWRFTTMIERWGRV